MGVKSRCGREDQWQWQLFPTFFLARFLVSNCEVLTSHLLCLYLEDIGSDLGGSEVEDDVAFREKIEPLLLERNLKKSDLQVYLKVEDVETVSGFIGKDWYSFGKAMDVDTSTLDGIKEDNLKKGLSKRDMKGDLLRYLIRNDKVRYERIIYGHYNLCSDSPFIITILDYLAKERLTSKKTGDDYLIYFLKNSFTAKTSFGT